MVERRVFAEEFRTQRRKLLSEDLHLSEPSRELAFPGFHLLEEQRPMAASCVSDYTAVGLAERLEFLGLASP